MDAEVVERAQEVLLSASHSRSSAATRPSKNSRTSTPSARSGVAVSPTSSIGLHVVEQPPVGRGLGVMELVDDHDVEVIGFDAGKPCLRERLDAGEHVAPLGGFLPIDQQLTERRRR